MSFKYVTRWEEQGIGAQWSNFYDNPVVQDNFSVGWATNFLLLDTILYLTLMWYFENVLPGNHWEQYNWELKELFIPFSEVVRPKLKNGCGVYIDFYFELNFSTLILRVRFWRTESVAIMIICYNKSLSVRNQWNVAVDSKFVLFIDISLYQEFYKWWRFCHTFL